MLNKIKQFLIIIAGFVSAYIFGKYKGTENEKIKNIKKVQTNIELANDARSLLYDSDNAKRLHEKYKRQ